MKLFKVLLAAGILVLANCHPKKVSKKTMTPLIAKDTTIENEKNNRLFVFVGEKIEITPIPFRQGNFDAGLKAKYKVILNVYGDYNNDVIEFEAYDHYDAFPFLNYKNVMLYISEEDGKFYQEKYMYDPVFQTKNGRWAGPYSSDYDHSYNENTTVKIEKINFASDAVLPTKRIDKYGKEMTFSYEEPYFKTVGDSARIVYGNYVEDLFQLKKEGVLTARELFGNKKKQ